MTSKDISIVILTYNRKDCLHELLSELRDLREHVAEIVVVDNCTTDGTERMLADEFPEFRALRTDRNVGVSARNLGMSRAVGDIVVTIDDDIMGLDAGAMDRVAAAFAADPGLGALNFQVRDWFTGNLCNWVHHRPAADAGDRFETYEITEGAVAFRREAIERIGGYCEDYFISHEGPDLAYRLMNLDLAVRYDGGIVVRHKHEAGARQPWRFYYYDTRNQVWLAVRNMPWRYAAVYLGRGLAAMLVYALRDGYVRWWVQAVHDALARLPEMRRQRDPWRPATLAAIGRIDAHRPGFWTLVRKRLFQPVARLDE